MYGWLIALVLSAGLVAGGYFYYIDTQQTIKDLTASTVTLKLAVEESLRTINKMETDLAEEEKTSAKLSADLRAAKQYQLKLNKTLRSHDLTKLTAAKPGLIEARINEATKQLLEELESSSAKQLPAE